MTKTADLADRLAKDWCSAPELGTELKWKPHTLRAAISGIAKTREVERKREDGVTFYRIAVA